MKTGNMRTKIKTIYEFGNNPPGRLRDLPLEHQVTFQQCLTDCNCPKLVNCPDHEQDFFFQQYYDDWKTENHKNLMGT